VQFPKDVCVVLAQVAGNTGITEQFCKLAARYDQTEDLISMRFLNQP
jgi:hypothetical protein